MPTQPTDAAPPRWRAALLIAIGLLLLGTALGVWIYVTGDGPFAVDRWWNSLLNDWTSEAMLTFSRVMNWVGGGWFGVLVVPILGAAILLFVRRPWSAAFFLSAEAVSAGIVQLLKNIFGRGRPEDILVLSDYGSFPSGHVANAATLAAAAVVLVPRLWVVIVGAVWVLLMALSRTYLHAHWLTDTLGGALIGIGAALAMAAAFSRLLERDVRAAQARATRSQVGGASIG